MADKAKPIAIFVADLHLQHNPPILRSKEPDWYAAMARPLRELKNLATKYAVPVFCAGDVFTFWKAPPELINFALDELPEMYSIAGQHDLPQHSPTQLNRSAYQTMIQSGKLHDMWTSCYMDQHLQLYTNDHFHLVGMPYEVKLFPRMLPTVGEEPKLAIAMQHKYLWTPNSTVPKDQIPNNNVAHDLKCNWDVLVYGDNHMPYTNMVGKTRVINCGTTMRRLKPELKIHPGATILYSDYRVKRHQFDTNTDVYWRDYESVPELEQQTDPELCKKVAAGLQSLGEAGLDFQRAAESYLSAIKISKRVLDIILQTLDEANNE
jgi:hypothetical protein